ncbi:MAG: hypothetical protein KatS3mg129_1426 [Leptospiraceae bacterium]|nr:MAG: hypothetical protein KatS3mg129_1426 [Leptospiraceae bacterium]
MKRISIITLFLFLSSAIWGYETDWQDNKLGPTQFKLHGYFWFGYENIDTQKGTVDTGTKQGFTMNRAYVRIDGKVTDGDFKGWKYHLTIDGVPGGSEFLKYAYFGIPLPADLTLIGGLQSNPTSTAGKYSLEKLWDHRYLDADGKAMWDQLGVAASSDLGIGIEQTKELYNFNIQIGNGEGYSKSSNAASISNTKLSDLAKGSGDSYGYHLYGRLSLTPLGTKEDLPTRIFIHLPFVFRNFYGIQRSEYEYVEKLDFTKPTGSGNQFSILKGNPKAKQDYAYGVEANVFLNMGDIKIGIGAGQIIDKDIRRDAFKIDDSLLTTPITIANLYNYYEPAKDSIGIANYIFLWMHYQKFGIVARYYVNTDDGTMNGKLKHAEGLSVDEQLIKQDAKDGILGNLSAASALQLIRSGQVDEGKSKMKTILLAFEYYMNERYKMAIGIKQSTTTNKDGTPYKITPFQANNIGSYTTDSYATLIASQAGLPTGVLTDKDIIGTKRIDRQIFFRSQFTY